MHAFDAAFITSKTIVPRRAKNKEKLTLLDGQTVELTDQDLVITDGKRPLALGGVMGGKDTGISAQTTSIFLESANFDATTIRKTAARHKQRTEASARFEKSLDPNQNVPALLRFLRLLDDAKINARSSEIFSLGTPTKEGELAISHEFLEKRLGVTLAPLFVAKTFSKLGFGFEQVSTDGKEGYKLTIPTFRSTKDVRIKEDIVEEIGRFFGYVNIPQELPLMQLSPSNVDWVYRVRSIKEMLAYALTMREINSYSFFDEDFLRELGWEPGPTASVQSPVSENWRRLVTSLVPGLLKAVQLNVADNDQLRFFEWARTWSTAQAGSWFSGKTGNLIEKKVLAGILFDQRKAVDFYEAKEQLMILFQALNIDVAWERVDKSDCPWFLPYQTAYVTHKGDKIGIVGKIHPGFMSKVSQGDAVLFELDGDFLLRYKAPTAKFIPASRYQAVGRDISMLIPVQLTADEIMKLIEKTDNKITSVALLDFFEKDEWKDQKSMTFRFIMQDHEKTLSKEEVDAVWDTIADKLKKLGATIR